MFRWMTCSTPGVTARAAATSMVSLMRTLSRVCLHVRVHAGFDAPQVGAAAGREPIAHAQALGETEVLQLADVELERLGLAPDAGREVRRPHLGVRGDQPEILGGPGSVGAAGVESQEPGAKLGELVFRELVALAQLDAGIESRVVEVDPVEVALTVRERVEELRARRGAGAARVCRR